MDDDLGDLTRLSRAELEPMLADRLDAGDAVAAEAIRAELASRTWQHDNPYAGSLSGMPDNGPPRTWLPSDNVPLASDAVRAARLNLTRDAWDAAISREDWAEADRLEAEVADLERQLGPLPPGMP